MTTGRHDGHLRYLLTAYLFENLSDDGRAEVEAHLAECAACRAELEELGETRSLVEEALALPGGGESEAGETAPTAPYSFEAHRLERVLVAGRRRPSGWRRAGWYSAAAMVVIALIAALVLPNLITAGGSARRLSNLTQSAMQAEELARVEEERSAPEQRPAEASRIVAGMGGAASGGRLSEVDRATSAGEEAYGYRADRTAGNAPPPASTPAPAAPGADPTGSAEPRRMPPATASSANERGDPRAEAVLAAREARVDLQQSDTLSDRLGASKSVPPSGTLSMGLLGGDDDAAEPAPSHGDEYKKEGEAAAEGRVSLGESLESLGAGSGGKLDSDDTRLGRDRAAAAAEPAAKPAAPADEAAKRRSLEKSIRSEETRRDRGDLERKELEDQEFDSLEIGGAPSAEDAKRGKWKEPARDEAEVRKKKGSEPLPVIELFLDSEKSAPADAPSLRVGFAGAPPRAIEPGRLAPPAPSPVGGAAPDPASTIAPDADRAQAIRSFEEGTRLNRFEQPESQKNEESRGERMSETRYAWTGPPPADGSVLVIPPSQNPAEPPVDKSQTGIHAFGAEWNRMETSMLAANPGGIDEIRLEDRTFSSVAEPGDQLRGFQFHGGSVIGDPTMDSSLFAPPEGEMPWHFSEGGESLNPLGLRGNTLAFDNKNAATPGTENTMSGRIPAMNLMRFLQEKTGLPVNHPSSAMEETYAAPNTITVFGRDFALDPSMVATILELNGYDIQRQRQSDGSDVLNISGFATDDGSDATTLALRTDPAIQNALLAAAGQQAPQLGWRFAPTALDPATQKAGFVIRAPRAAVEQLQRAVDLAESGAVAQDPGALAGWFSGVLAGTIAPLPGSDLAVRAEARAEEERTLRAYDHYKRNDPALDHRTFAARRLPVPAPVIGDEGLGQEGFRARYGVNPFVETERDRFSTFAMDVDTASYTRARTMLAEGRLPDPGAVRTEEFVNAFPDPRAADPSRAFSVFCEGGPAPFAMAGARETGSSELAVEQVQITVKARDLAPAERRPAILTFAIDTSGSMELGSRLDLVRSALAVLLGSLAPDDRVGIVAYGTQAYLVLPHTPARERERIAGALDSLACHGATNVEAGLDLAYRLADEVAHPRAANRVIVCSDGVATSGERDAAALLRRVRVYADRGIYLSVVGFGEGRYDDAFLERIANQGNGQYGYVNSLDDALRLFHDNLPAALSVLARDAKIQVDFDPAVVRQYRLLGYENRDVKDEDFRNDKIDAGEVGPGSTVTAIYEVVRRPASAGDLGRVHLRYHDTSLGRVEEIDFPIPPGVVATRLEGTSERFRLLASVAELAELLRGSYFARDGAYSAVLATLATLSPATVARPEVQEFIDMSLRARDLSLEQWARE